MAARIAGFSGEFLWELEIAERQIVAIAESIPAEQYDWRPVAQARSFSEVFVHVATGNFMLLDVIGVGAPIDLYPQVPADGVARFQGLIRRNDELAAGIREKDAVVGLVRRSLQAVSQSLAKASNDELNRRLSFLGEETTVRRVYLRLCIKLLSISPGGTHSSRPGATRNRHRLRQRANDQCRQVSYGKIHTRRLLL